MKTNDSLMGRLLEIAEGEEAEYSKDGINLNALIAEAAARITKLESEVARLEASLAKIKEWATVHESETSLNEWHLGYDDARSWVRDVGLVQIEGK